MPISVLVLIWVRSFIEPDLLDNNLPENKESEHLIFCEFHGR